jgi:peroxiredoxin (alkyl hydroperoxide reductase subunit C)
MYYPLSNGRNIDEILRLVDSLQMTAKHGRATPANWPNNAIFGSDVIVPPATSMEEAQTNPAKYEHKDWYLCTEKMPK